MRSRIDGSDAVFVGRLDSTRPSDEAAKAYYRFAVLQKVKGPLGAEVELLAPRLVDVNDRPLEIGVEAGVLANLAGATFTTDSCGLTHPGVLLAEADEPRGGAIKLLVGITILAAALAYALVRLRRRR